MATKLCDSSEIPAGSARVCEAGDRKILVFHLSDGYFATQSKCPHLFWPLKNGKVLEDKCVQCPFHHAQFDIRSGEVVQWANRPPGIGALDGVRPPKALETFTVSERAGAIYLDD